MRVLTVRVVPRPGAVLRALLATLEIVLGTVAAHTWAGGTLPSPAWVATMTGLVLVASVVVLSRGVRARVAVPALAAAQVFLHCWLVALSPGHAMPGHDMTGPHLELTVPMLAAHLAAAVLTAVVWALRRHAVDVVLAWAAVVRVVVSVLRRRAAAAAPTVVRRRLVLAVAPRRGPPRLLAPA